MNYQTENDRVIVNCGNRLEINSVDLQMQVLKDVLAIKKPIIFSADEINYIDTSALQLFLGFTFAATQQNIKWEWQNPSAELLRAAHLLGMNMLLGLPEQL